MIGAMKIADINKLLNDGCYEEIQRKNGIDYYLCFLRSQIFNSETNVQNLTPEDFMHYINVDFLNSVSLNEVTFFNISDKESCDAESYTIISFTTPLKVTSTNKPSVNQLLHLFHIQEFLNRSER